MYFLLSQMFLYWFVSYVSMKFEDLSEFRLNNKTRTSYWPYLQNSASIETGYLGPMTSITDFNLSICKFLRNINDNQNKVCVNPDVTPNYHL